MLSVNRGWSWLLLLPLLAAVAADAGWRPAQHQLDHSPDQLDQYAEPVAPQEVPTALDMALLQQLTNELAENEAISPFVMSSLMTQVFLGTGGTTRDELRPVLGLEEDPETGVALDYLGGYRSAIDYLSSNSSNATVAVFNGMYVRRGFSVKPSFKATLRDVYRSDATTVLSSEETATEINRAVSDVTRGKIRELVSAEQLQHTDLVLVSALYFKALWKQPFSRVTEGSFLTAEGERQVKMMSLPHADFMQFASLTTFDAVAVPYADPDYCLLLLVPSERSMPSVQALLDTLATLNITDIVGQLKWRDVVLKMPKFKIEAEYSLPEPLLALGIQEIFSPDANFSGMTEERGVFVSEVIHKVFLEVTEEGTEAAGAGASFSTRIVPKSFTLDRPFVAVVYNTRHNLNLFSAYVASPTTDSTPAYDVSSQHHDPPHQPKIPLRNSQLKAKIISAGSRIQSLLSSTLFSQNDYKSTQPKRF